MSRYSMKCLSPQRTAGWKCRRILLTATVLIFWCVIGPDHSLDPDGPAWLVSDVDISKVFVDEVIRNLKTLNLQKLAMLRYTGKQRTCTSSDFHHTCCIEPKCPPLT